ncbi:amidase [Povalibacter sp.]|uniref:amidase n=1 Tax=Povalibacter sp. TaxID=1962978 RepID=UPI002F42F2C7
MSTTAIPSTVLPRRALLRGLAGFATSAVAAKSASAASTDTSDQIVFMSATKLAGLIRARKVSAVEAVNAYIQRTEEVNDRLNAVVMRSFARARKEAAELDKRAARRDFAGALHGVPMTIKDSFDTEGVISTGGTYGRQQYVPARDATVVARLRREGAILLGKTNTPEFTLGGVGGINTSSNKLYGSSHNPYDLTLTTSGSSGGAAAIVAAGGAAFDIGSDLGGSIRLPAHVNGVAGLKTTAGRVPRTGHIVDYGGVLDLWQQLGPITRRVEDLALITPLISGPDYRDAACIPVPWSDYRKVQIDKKLRVGFFAGGGESFKADEDTQKMIRQVAGWVGDAATVTEAFPTELLRALNATSSKLAMGDGWQWYKRLADKWGTKNLSSEMGELIASTPQMSTADYVRVWDEADQIKTKLLTWMEQFDVLLCPASKNAATPIDRIYNAADGGGSVNLLGAFNCTGWPVAVVRAGTTNNSLPLGVQVVAAPWREDRCLAVAGYIEARSGGWRAPPI